jgi:hypothetical protein
MVFVYIYEQNHKNIAENEKKKLKWQKKALRNNLRAFFLRREQN